MGERAGLWKNSAGRYEVQGKKVYGKEILRNPEQYFTDEVMEQLNQQAQIEFLYGASDDGDDWNNYS